MPAAVRSGLLEVAEPVESEEPAAEPEVSVTGRTVISAAPGARLEVASC